MLRASVEINQAGVELDGLTDPNVKSIVGVPHSAELLRFADTFLGDDEAAFIKARQMLIDTMGVEAMVDAAGIASNFQRMVRIADSIGIPSDAPMVAITEDLREQLGINEYNSASNTPKLSFLKGLLMKYVVVRKFRDMIRAASG